MRSSIVRLCVAASALAAVSLALAAPAMAGDRPSPIGAISGERMLLMKGFIGDRAADWQLHLRLDRTNGQVGLGTQRWRACAGHEEACAAGTGEGDGWSEPVAFRIVRTPGGSFVGSGALGQMFVSVAKGKLVGSFIGQPTTGTSVKGGDLRGGSGGHIIAGEVSTSGMCNHQGCPPK